MIDKKDLLTLAKQFYEKDAKHEEIENCGKAIIAKMYASKKETRKPQWIEIFEFSKVNIK